MDFAGIFSSYMFLISHTVLRIACCLGVIFRNCVNCEPPSHLLYKHTSQSFFMFYVTTQSFFIDAEPADGCMLFCRCLLQLLGRGSYSSHYSLLLYSPLTLIFLYFWHVCSVAGGTKSWILEHHPVSAALPFLIYHACVI